MQNITGARGTGPFYFAAQTDGSGGEGESSLGDDQAHGYGGGVPSAGGEALKKARLGGGFVEVEGLRVEFGGEGFDASLGHFIGAGGELLAYAHIV